MFPVLWMAITAFKHERDLDIYFWGALMAGALLVGLPAALAFNLVIDRFIQGLTGVGDD